MSKKARIILIEDERQVLSLIEKILTHAGYSVETATDGDSGLALHRENPADLIITDIIMPEKEGIETIQELRRDDPSARIIAISGGGRIGPESYLQLAKKFGAQATLSKPFKKNALLEAVEEVLGVKSSVAPEK